MQDKSKINQEALKLWYLALKSGKYNQGFEGLLHYYNAHYTKYCCLGVLCEIALDSGTVELETCVVPNSIDACGVTFTKKYSGRMTTAWRTHTKTLPYDSNPHNFLPLLIS